MVFVLLALDAYNVSLFPRGTVDPVRIGNLGDWFTGVATAGAVAIAASGLRRDRVRVEDERKDAERDKAGELYVWLEQRRLRPGRASSVLSLVNRTPVPVYEWQVEIEDLPGASIDQSAFGPILPGEKTIELEADDFEGLRHIDGSRAAISFESSIGLRLRRGFDGALSEAR